MIADVSQPYRRLRASRRSWDRERRAALALAIAMALVILLGGLVHASLSAPQPAQVTVAAGDTLWSIASAQPNVADVRAEVDAIMEANHLAGPQLVPGQVLLVPPS